jgi:hypothetical protein
VSASCGLITSLRSHQFVAEGHVAPHPHPPLLGSSDLVADALAGHLALELGKGQENIQGQPPHRGRRVELLGHRDERDLVLIEDLDQPGEVGQRSGQPVDLVGHHHLDPAGADIGEKALQGRALHRAAREPAIIVGGRDQDPAFVALAADIGFARLALGVQRIELLLQPLLG